jgi:hypothetical protein
VPFLAAAVVVAACYGAGMAITAGGRLTGGATLRSRSSAFALGFAALASLALLLGVLGAFTQPLLVTVASVAAAIGVGFAVLDLRGRRRPERDAAWWLLAAAAAIAVLDVVLASAPPTSGDATAYHLTGPKLWLDAGRIFSIWWDWATFQPFAVELNGAFALAIGGGGGAMAAAAALTALSAVPVYGLGRELAGRTPGAVAALLWVGQGMFLWEATGAFPEAIGGGLVALAVWHLVCFARAGAAADPALAGIALGAAASTKYHALLFVPVLAVAAVVLEPRRRLRALTVFGAGAAIALPWYVKNLVVTGNPLYPLAASVFGGKLWSEADQAWWTASYAGYGPTSAWKAPLFPLFFLADPSRYERGYSISLALLVLAPLGAVVGGRLARWLGAALLAYLVLWSLAMHQITRYLVLVLPVAAVLAALGGRWAWERSRAWRLAVASVLGLAAAALVAITALFAWQVVPGVVGTQSTGAYVQRLTGTYDALQWVDRRLPSEGRVLVFGVRNLYWLDRPYVAYYPPLFAAGDAPAYDRAQMRRYDVRYVATLAGLPPGWLQPELRLLGTREVPIVSSRTLLRITGHTALRLYAWCRGSADPCGARA